MKEQISVISSPFVTLYSFSLIDTSTLQQQGKTAQQKDKHDNTWTISLYVSNFLFQLGGVKSWYSFEILF